MPHLAELILYTSHIPDLFWDIIILTTISLQKTYERPFQNHAAFANFNQYEYVFRRLTFVFFEPIVFLKAEKAYRFKRRQIFLIIIETQWHFSLKSRIMF